MKVFHRGVVLLNLTVPHSCIVVRVYMSRFSPSTLQYCGKPFFCYYTYSSIDRHIHMRLILHLTALVHLLHANAFIIVPTVRTQYRYIQRDMFSNSAPAAVTLVLKQQQQDTAIPRKPEEVEEEEEDILSLLLSPMEQSNHTAVVTVTNSITRLNVSTSSASSSPPPPSFLTSSNNTLVGIGGKGGIVYDVNRLKRNLVQETVRKYKNELLVLLSQPSLRNNIQYSTLMEEKIHALIQANPVYTTTDSNLLEGTWMYMVSLPADMYRSQGTTTSATTSKSQQQPPSSGLKNRNNKKQTTLGSWKTFQRTFNLENVQAEEKPFVVDEMIHWSGWYSSQTLFQIIGLTRKQLQLQVDHVQETWLWNKKQKQSISNKARNQPSIVDLHILYLDSDLCISKIQDELQVFTKNEKWTGKRLQMEQKAQWLLQWKSPWKLRSKWNSLVSKRILKSTTTSTTGASPLDAVFIESSSSHPTLPTKKDSMVLLKEYQSGSKLKVVRLGNIWKNEKDEDGAWEGNEDPFVHLSADERQAKLKTMSIEEIQRAGKEFKKQKDKAKQRASWRRRRPKSFRRPE